MIEERKNISPSLNASQEAINEAEKILDIRLPEELKHVWLICNGFDYPPDWRIFPVFDKSMPKKCWGNIVEENKKSSYDYIQEDLLKIASDSYGNNLVLRVSNGIAGDSLYTWDHETTKLRKSSITFTKLQTKARKRVENIQMKIARNLKKRR
jgi:hypothetical protein